MAEYEFLTNESSETVRIAKRLSELLGKSDVVTLEGDLGAGKTTFTKGLALGLGIKRNVNSPTFTIIKEYKDGRLPLYHMDVYRVEDADEDLGFDEYFHGDGVTVVEWAHLIEDQLPKERLDIRILYVNESQRKIMMTPYGTHYLEICKELSNESTSN
ncbi:tRNA (adenosine(37)-N6)-threonylcarbamoyltransferase complex ATPase subunit type 1 TsaE [Metabacillus sediminilitoris]|uniref:tRNA threonylcarbamoyladenosine biosynthesis protein TsaE n=1 Tax=Metabacillus sediminilitoris TaxID=2567941 RepID=A0A4S4BNJ3_9BACI|nr:tRNA (adenosine(37)-N6)-threonylcarbamoyltransferase complex ATPase subunit type 1 TsaE [Metabacillus sediminilitoris]QGQ44088.1 tRNA (adenosine(37)-N6)-threonylcarbamoyltransferase complex ATPase subunit type 1 TsaE [Metabacillus sediminilitoris]THF75533.1 tRNA (adenosine(37)-N6)-threonylcarbamoyltransferase complex ATPase subunit type 1 TsaE [Metabacillus sediminilitoris]